MRENKCLKIFLATGFMFLQFFALPQNDSKNKKFENPSLEPLFSVQQIFGTLEDELSADEVFTLSLLLSECPLDSDVAQNTLKKFNQLKEEISSPDFAAQSDEERGRAILKLMYRDILKKYNFYQTTTNAAFEDGLYNCVSSAVIYMALAKHSGLTVKGQKAPEHAFCTIYVPDSQSGKVKKIDVETTNPYGFNPGSKESVENEDQIKKYYVVPKKNYSNRQEVSDKVFVGLIAGNLCSYYINDKDYFHSVPLGSARYNLVKNENSKAVNEVRRDFDVLVCNHANSRMATAESCADVLQWLSEYYDTYGKSDYLQKNFDSAFYNLMVMCWEEKNYDFAKENYDLLKKYVSPNQIKKADEILAETQVQISVNEKSYEEQIVILNELLQNPDFQSAVQQKQATDALERAWINFLNEYMRAKDYETGLEKSKEAVRDLPKSQSAKKLNSNFYTNCIAVIHNNFAKAANRGNYEDAVLILEEGLKKFPDDKTLQKDLQNLRKVFP